MSGLASFIPLPLAGGVRGGRVRTRSPLEQALPQSLSQAGGEKI